MIALKHGSRRSFFILAVMPLFLLINPIQAKPIHASIVIEADTGKVLHQSHADASRYPASLTKMMTLYMLFEALEQRKITLNSLLPVSAYAASMPSTNISLKERDTISVHDAISALIVRSANDVAVVVAEALGDTEVKFGRLMTNKARKLRMYSTTFRNASGLANKGQVTTARDMAILSSRLVKDFPQYYHYFSNHIFNYKGVTYHNHNRMVRNTLGVDGLKTGFIRASGFNIATSAKRGNRRVIAVIMGGSTAASRDYQMAQLLDRILDPRDIAHLAKNSEVNSLAPAVVQKSNTLTPASVPLSLNKTPELAMLAITTPMPIHNEPKEINTLISEKGWEVQIGSYLAHDRAQAQVQIATRWVPTAVAITEVEISNRKLYRARLVGLQEKQARTACQSLSRQGIACIVVRSDN